MKKLNLHRREWMRGYISAADRYRPVKEFTKLEELNEEYKKYVKDNPSIKKEFPTSVWITKKK